MKQFLFVAISLSTALVFSYCSSSKKTAVAKPVPVLNYESNIQALVLANCSPCHIPAKGGNKLALDTYEALKTNIDAVIGRIERNPGERGFMPMKRAKLSDSAIAVFKQWKIDGLTAK